MSKFSVFLKGLQWPGRIFLLVLLAGVIFGFKKGYDVWFPKSAKNNVISTKASLPPLAYDKSANAPHREVSEFNEPVDIQSPEIRGELMGWNAQSGLMYAVGGSSTSKGSICEELGLNIKLSVQNSCAKQGEDLYAFAESLHAGESNPSKGCHFIAWMGDGVPSYLAGLNARLKADFGEEYQAQVLYFGGASFGEDKWLVKKKFEKDARGSLTCTVFLDGDWNICVLKSQTNGWDVNNQIGTYDPKKVNFMPAPNDDYMEAAKFYVSGQKTSLKLIKDGKIVGDTLMACTGVSTWFPGDLQAVKEKGGLVNIASTAEYGAQMANAIIFIGKWAKDNRPLVEKFIEAIGKGGDQVKSHDDALQFASKVSELVYADQNMNADAWYQAFKSYDLTDDDGNTVKIGGSRVFNLADAALYTGVSGGSDKYKSVYTTFGKIASEASPDRIKDIIPYEQVTDWSYLRAVYSKNKGSAGIASKADFTEKTTEVSGDASYSIEFATGSAEINPSSYTVLDKIAGQLVVASNLYVEISGHTDNTGNPSSNKILSEARAKSVREYLLSKDREEFLNRTSAKGYGQDRPMADNNTTEGKAKNRRVEIKLLKTKL